jgi:hypothetical protein
MTPNLAQVRPVIVSALGAPCELVGVIASVSTGLGERVSGGCSAAALDSEFVALGVGHHDPTTRRGLASVVNDPRTEEQYPVDFLILCSILRNQIKVNPVLDGLRVDHVNEYEPRGARRRQSNHPEGVAGHLLLRTRPIRELAPETRRRSSIRAVERDVQNRKTHVHTSSPALADLQPRDAIDDATHLFGEVLAALLTRKSTHALLRDVGDGVEPDGRAQGVWLGG